MVRRDVAFDETQFYFRSSDVTSAVSDQLDWELPSITYIPTGAESPVDTVPQSQVTDTQPELHQIDGSSDVSTDIDSDSSAHDETAVDEEVQERSSAAPPSPIPTSPQHVRNPVAPVAATPVAPSAPSTPITPSLIPIASWRTPTAVAPPPAAAAATPTAIPTVPPATAAPTTPSHIPLATWRFLQQDSLLTRPPAPAASSSQSALALTQQSLSTDPRTMAEALRSADAPEWTKAMVSEMESMRTHGVWELVEPPPKPTNVIGCKWVYKVKRNSDGAIERYKARLVAQGYNQKYGSDYFKVFSPVAGFDSVRCVLSFAASMDMEIHHIDIKTAFLHGELDEELYMKQPPGFAKAGEEHLVCKLRRSIYGLRQSPRQWNQALHSFLASHGFKRSICDHCVYIRHTGTTRHGLPEILVVYVDDILVIAPTVKQVEALKTLLKSRFDVTDLGELEFFLGIRVHRDRVKRLVFLDQSTYIQDMLQRYGLQDCNSCVTPVEKGLYLPKASTIPIDPEEEERLVRIPYREAVGSLLYCSVSTRPDIAYAVSAVSQHLNNYREVHWKAVKHILRYLKGTKDYALQLGGGSSSGDTIDVRAALKLQCFADADWASDPVDRKSVSGVFFTLGNGAGAFSWQSKKQTLVASSSTEAECIALWQAVKYIDHLLLLLAELGCPQSKPTVCFQDNQSAIAVCNMERPKSKYIDVKHCFVKDKVQAGDISISYLKGTSMPADILTKPLASAPFYSLLQLLGVVPPQQSLQTQA